MKSYILLLLVLFTILNCNKNITKIKSQEKKTIPKISLNKIDTLQQLKFKYESGVINKFSYNLQNVDTIFKEVINFAKSMEGWGKKDIDSLTIYSDLYWKAYVVMAIEDPSLDIIRMSLLGTQHLNAKSNYMRQLLKYRRSSENYLYKEELYYFGEMYSKLWNQAAIRVNEGIKVYDSGQFKASEVHYREALKILPKMAWAEYEIGQIRLISPDSVETLISNEGIINFKRARTWDPFYQFAWQGKKENIPKMISIMEKKNKVYPNIARGTNDIKKFEIFAECAVDVGYYEIAAYTYYLLTFFKTPDGNLKYAKLMTDQLRNLGCNDAADELDRKFSIVFAEE